MTYNLIKINGTELTQHGQNVNDRAEYANKTDA